MTKLVDLLMENTVEQRVNLIRIETILGNLAPQLSESDKTKLAKSFVELSEFANMLNATPRTSFNADQWKWLTMILAGKLAELRLITEDIAEDNKEIDCWPLIKAIDLVLTN